MMIAYGIQDLIRRFLCSRPGLIRGVSEPTHKSQRLSLFSSIYKTCIVATGIGSTQECCYHECLLNRYDPM
jgi:hypothetical protein